MKYNELKYEKLGDMIPVYPRSTLVIRKQFVDTAIAELKAKEVPDMDNLKWYWVYIPYLDLPEQQQESALKAGYSKVYFKDNVDAEIRQLKHALWSMTASWATAMAEASANIASKFRSHETFISDAYRNKTIKRHRHRMVVFNKYADYCRTKAEMYK